MDNLFAAPQQDPSGARSVVKFKCGRMTHEQLADGSFRVTAVPARGFLELLSEQANMFRLVWSTRDGDIPSDPNNNVILIKSEQTFEKVSTGNDGDRVFLLSLTNANPVRRFFFWVQEPDADDDDALLKKVREALGCNETDALNAALIAMGILPETAAGATPGGPTEDAPAGGNGDGNGGGHNADGTPEGGDAGAGGAGDEDTKQDEQ